GQRLTGRQQGWIGAAANEPRLVQRGLANRAASFLVPLRTGEIDENPPHQLSGQSKELGTTAQMEPTTVDEPQVRLVHQSRGLESMLRPFTSHIMASQPAEMIVHDGRELTKRVCVAAFPRQQQLLNVWCG